MSKSKTLSVSRSAHARFKAAADEFGMSLAELVEAACADLPTEPAAANALADRVWRNMPQQSRTARGG